MAFRTLKPGEKRKIDLCRNGKAVRKNESNRIPLRIDDRTIIFVEPQNCNAEYAANYKNKFYLTQKA